MRAIAREEWRSLPKSEGNIVNLSELTSVGISCCRMAVFGRLAIGPGRECHQGV